MDFESGDIVLVKKGTTVWLVNLGLGMILAYDILVEIDCYFGGSYLGKRKLIWEKDDDFELIDNAAAFELFKDDLKDLIKYDTLTYEEKLALTKYI